jgi:hypothetical protein
MSPMFVLTMDRSQILCLVFHMSVIRRSEGGTQPNNPLFFLGRKKMILITPQPRPTDGLTNQRQQQLVLATTDGLIES